MDIGLGSSFRHIGHRIMRVSQYRSHRSFWYGTSRYGYSNVATRNGSGGMADRERIQSICNRFSVCENNDERALECDLGLHHREREGLQPSLNPPPQIHGNARGLDLKSGHNTS